jgi:GNAT superfamily N-acetyltransferase
VGPGMARLVAGPGLSADPGLVRPWCADAMARHLYRDDGMARLAFRGELPVYAMLYLPGVAWVLYHGMAHHDRPHGSVYVRPDMRRRGIGRAIATRGHEEWRALREIEPIARPIRATGPASLMARRPSSWPSSPP